MLQCRKTQVAKMKIANSPQKLKSVQLLTS